MLASLGGKPKMPRDRDEAEDTVQGSNDTLTGAEEEKWSTAERGVPREGVRERAGAWKEA